MDREGRVRRVLPIVKRRNYPLNLIFALLAKRDQSLEIGPPSFTSGPAVSLLVALIEVVASCGVLSCLLRKDRIYYIADPISLRSDRSRVKSSEPRIIEVRRVVNSDNYIRLDRSNKEKVVRDS